MDSHQTSNPERSCKFGIVYLSYIPEGLNVKILREILQEFGDVGRIYLEPESTGKKRRTYSEGWVEFNKKRVAKLVAKTLNGTPLQYGRKHSKMNGQIWSIRYLHKFKWTHLTEQLTHDRAVKNQKRRFELDHTKKQVEFYQNMVERSKIMKKNPRLAEKVPSEDKMKVIEKRQIKPREMDSVLDVKVDEDFLSSIFRKVS